MNFEKSIKISEIKIEDKGFEIRASEHSYLRMIERNVDMYVITGEIISLGKRIFGIKTNGYDEGIIIDKTRNIAVVFGVEGNVVKIITVINRSNVFVKTGTRIFNI